MKNNLKQGFTLVEIILVVTTIALLASIGFASYNEARNKARNDVIATELQQVQVALALYNAEHGHYPARSGCTAGTTGAPGLNRSGSRGSCGDDYIPNLTPDFIVALPSHTLSSDSECEFQYIPSPDSTAPSSYKLQARNCVVGFTVTRNHELYRCGQDCTDALCAESLAVNQRSFAVYSAGSECIAAGG